MSKLTLSAEQKLTLESFFQKLRLTVVGTPGAYPDNLGFILSEILGGQVSLASYTTATRPTSPTAGDIIYNSTTVQPEFWSGSAWIPIGPDGAGTVTSVATTADLTGGPITTTGTLGLANTAVVAGSYTKADITVDAKGRLTAAANGTAVTSVATGTGLTGGPITATGTVSLANTAVTPGSYTNTSLTVDQQGRLTAAANGATATLASVYAAGTAAADQTLLIQAGDGGAIIAKANGAATGSLLKAQTSSAGDLLDINDNSTQLIKSAMADGASAIALKVDSASAWVNATAKLLSICNNNVEKFSMGPTGVANFGSYITMPSDSSGGVFNAAGNRGFTIDDSTAAAISTFNGGIVPGIDNNSAFLNGTSIRRWYQNWAMNYAGAMQTNTAAGAISIDTTLGETYTLTASGNITSITLSDGLAGEMFTLVMVQDAGGLSVWTTTVVNAKIAGGVFTKTAAADAVDTLTFRWNGADWLEIGRTLALS